MTLQPTLKVSPHPCQFLPTARDEAGTLTSANRRAAIIGRQARSNELPGLHV